MLVEQIKNLSIIVEYFSRVYESCVFNADFSDVLPEYILHSTAS